MLSNWTCHVFNFDYQFAGQMLLQFHALQLGFVWWQKVVATWRSPSGRWYKSNEEAKFRLDANHQQHCFVIRHALHLLPCVNQIPIPGTRPMPAAKKAPNLRRSIKGSLLCKVRMNDLAPKSATPSYDSYVPICFTASNYSIGFSNGVVEINWHNDCRRALCM